MLQEKIKSEIKDAMLAKDGVRLSVLRGLTSAFTNELVAKGRKPTESLTDEEALAVVMRSVKQRKDSIDQFRKGGREDLVAEEESQLKYLDQYLPAMMDRAGIEKVVESKKSELRITDASQKGMFMSAVMKELKGKADGALVKEVVDSYFNK